MTLHNTASIAYAVISMARSMPSDTPGAHLTVGVLARAPGDGTQAICREIAAAMGMEVLEIRAPHIEYHTGAMSVGCGVPFEQAVATGKPVLVILDEAHGAQNGVLPALVRIMAKRVEAQPCAILAISTMAGEKAVAEQLAEGLDWDVGRIAMHRTDAENARLVERVAAAMN